jgi:hypothetical protein
VKEEGKEVKEGKEGRERRKGGRKEEDEKNSITYLFVYYGTNVLHAYFLYKR